MRILRERFADVPDLLNPQSTARSTGIHDELGCDLCQIITAQNVRNRWRAVVSAPGRGQWVYAKTEPYFAGWKANARMRELVNYLLQDGWEQVPTTVGYPKFRRRVT